jgi:hypothetical protein
LTHTCNADSSLTHTCNADSSLKHTCNADPQVQQRPQPVRQGVDAFNHYHPALWDWQSDVTHTAALLEVIYRDLQPGRQHLVAHSVICCSSRWRCNHSSGAQPEAQQA